ncbi:carboxymuconolactone decarboxylase family protein [Peribacillus frigoritolerans]|uniref:carboxymuconolactone decarboxylase family protein n=1 Tax=Peribacillus frigoritolerans TaxID=450367 RepID=UPI00345D0C28
MNKPITPTVRNSLGHFAPDFVRYSEEILFGDLWRRDNLNLRDRSLITVTSLVTGESLNQLPYHLELAKQNGLTEEELIETITHLSFYVGWPRSASALEVAKETFRILK